MVYLVNDEIINHDFPLRSPHPYSWVCLAFLKAHDILLLLGLKPLLKCLHLVPGVPAVKLLASIWGHLDACSWSRLTHVQLKIDYLLFIPIQTGAGFLS